MRERGRRHHVPAAYIGHFSPDPNLGNLRRSKIAVHRFDPPADFESVPENVEFFPGAYRVIPWVADPGVSIQKGSSSLAVHALRPVDRLRESSSHDFPAGEWAKVAAFIASLFSPTRSWTLR